MSERTVIRYNYDGSLDQNFNGTGIATKTVGQRSLCTGVALQNDDKIVVSGFSRETEEGRWGFLVMRYHSDGSLDNSFDADGVVTTTFGGQENVAEDILVQPDGKILAIGYGGIAGLGFHSTLVRYNSDGSLDMSFNNTGIVTTTIYERFGIISAGALQLDDKILVAGSQTEYGFSNDLVLARYNSDGNLDNSFNVTGVVTAPTNGYNKGEWSVVALSDNKILTAGRISRTLGLLQYNSDGTLDTTFNHTGIVTTPIGSLSGAYDLAIQGDGKIVAVGEDDEENRSYFAIVRYNADGTLDKSFNGGIITTIISSDYESNGASGVAIHDDGKIVVIGGTGTAQQAYFAVMRFLGNYEFGYSTYIPIIFRK